MRPGGRKDHQQHRDPPLEEPVEFIGRHHGEQVGEHPVARMEDEQPDDPRDGRRDPVGPEDRGPVEGEAADLLVGEVGQKERDGERQGGHPQREDEGVDDAAAVLRGGEELDEIVEPHEDLPVSEGGDLEEGEAQRVEGGPEEKDDDHDELRGEQEIGEPAVLEDASFHRPRLRFRISCTVDANFLRILLVPLLDGVVETLLGRLLSADDVFQLGLDVVADRREVAQADPLAVGGGLAAHDLVEGGPHVGVPLEMVRRLEGLRAPICSPGGNPSRRATRPAARACPGTRGISPRPCTPRSYGPSSPRGWRRR